MGYPIALSQHFLRSCQEFNQAWRKLIVSLDFTLEVSKLVCIVSLKYRSLYHLQLRASFNTTALGLLSAILNMESTSPDVEFPEQKLGDF